MGMFRSKAKAKPTDDRVESPPLLDDIPPPPRDLFAPPNEGSGHSTQSSSNLSSADTRLSQNQNPLRTKVITTTTTTTTTITVEPDGSAHTQTLPYNPATDPPPATETVASTSTHPTGNQQPLQSNVSQPIVTQPNRELYSNNDQIPNRQNSTSGGRPIPPRSELRNSLNVQSRTQPLLGNPPIPRSPGEATSQNYPNYPTSPTNSTYSSANPSIATHHTAEPVPVPGQGRRENLMSAVKGLHGAGDALRGSVNQALARADGDETGMRTARMLRERGLAEVRESGLREKMGERVAGGKLRKRSLSRGLRNGEGGLERVDERTSDF